MPTSTISPARRGPRLLPLALCWLAGLTAGHAQLTDLMGESVEAVTITSGLHVIASDATNAAAGYDRDTIQVEVASRYAALNATIGGTGTYNIRYELLASDGSPVPLATGGATANFVLGPSYLVSSTGSADVRTRSDSFGISPAAQLDSRINYRVRATIRQNLSNPPFVNFVDSGSGMSTARSFLHFMSTNSADAAVNVHAVIDSGPELLQPYLVETATDPTQRVFRARLRVDLHRYDGFAGQRTTTSIPHVITVSLRAGISGPVIAMGQAITTVNVVQWNHDLVAGVRVPSVINDRWLEFEFSPAQQLNSGGTIHTLDSRRAPRAPRRCIP